VHVRKIPLTNLNRGIKKFINIIDLRNTYEYITKNM